ncbi:MAG TPA: NAD-binding protein [Steroidobacteraceae bacterium]|nr:NAD-binding protein [Steroidobacteraceae bacterium]
MSVEQQPGGGLPADRRRRIPLGYGVWLQMSLNRVRKMLRMQAWFPHVPLALLVCLIGLAQLLFTSGSVPRLIALSKGGKSIAYNVATGLVVPAIRGAPQEAIGGLLVLMGVGLLLRSRLAWVLAFLLTLATVSLELSPLSTASRSLVFFNVLLLVLLLLTRRSFTRASLATGTLFALTAVLFTLGYGVLGSYVLGSGFRPPITNLTSAVYFAIVTLSTVGFGDITPQTPPARLFTVTLIVLGLVVFATSLTAILGPLVEQRMSRLIQPKRNKMKRTSHIIVVGDGALALNAIKSLAARGLPVTAICSRQRHSADQPEDVVLGDASDTEVLRGVNIDQARAVLALSEDDAYNAFVVLAAKELNPKVRTVAAVSDTQNSSRVARVHPDVILTLPVIGSELLAMALSGEEIKADAWVNQLLRLG